MGVSLSVMDSAWPFADVPLCPGVTFDKSVCSSVSMSASVWIVISTKSTCPPVSSDASLVCVSAVCGWVTGCCSLQSEQMHLASESSPGRAHSLCTHLKKYRDDQEIILDKIRNKPHNQYLHFCVNKPVADTAALQSDRWVGSLATNATCRAALTLAGLTHSVVVKPLGRTWQPQSTDTTLRTYTTPLT